MTKCMQDTDQFIAESVIPDYDTFLKSSIVYRDDASEVKELISKINIEIEELEILAGNIVNAIDEINSTVGEEAQGVADIAQKTTEVVISMNVLKEMVSTTVESVQVIDDMVRHFTL